MRAQVLLALVVFWALAVPALAADRQGAVSLDRILPEIRRTTPGTFYDAEGPFFGPDGRPAYRIKWMTPEGRIIWFYADARTGQVFGTGGHFVPPPAGRFRDDDRGWPPAGNSGGPHWGNGNGDGGGWGQGGSDRGNRGNGGGWGGDDNRHGGRGGDWGHGSDRGGGRGGGWGQGGGGGGQGGGGQGGGHGHDGNRGGPGGHGG